MSEFINTIDVLGDDVVTDSIITGTITEFKDDALTNLRTGAFAYCTSLVEVDLPNLTRFGSYVFNYCSSLKKVSSSAASIGHELFRRGCGSLDTFILRNTETIPTIVSTNVFNSTIISSGAGYIYVPKALLESYKVASNWSAFATKFRALEDYTVDGTVTGDLDESKI